mgnify:CR=1 FL=1
MIDSESGEQIAKKKIGRQNTNTLSWSPDGEIIASAGEDMNLSLWNWKEDAEIRNLVGHSGTINSIAWHPIENKIVSASSDKTVRIWDTESGTEIQKLEGHNKKVTSVVWSASGEKVASGSMDETIIIWDASGGKELITIEGSSGITSISWHPEGKLIASGNDDGILELWDSETGELFKTVWGFYGQIYSVAWSHDGKKLAAAGAGGTIRVWNYDDVVSAPGEIANENDVEVYPNPFSERCIIRYELEQPGNVQLRVFNSVGELVEARDFAYQAEGMHRYEFRGAELAAGMYYFTLQSGSGMRTGKLLLIR